MKRVTSRRSGLFPTLVLAYATALAATAGGEPMSKADSGPYNARFLEGGTGLERALSPASRLAAAGSAWSMTGWVRATRTQAGEQVVAAVGSTDGARLPAGWRGWSVVDGELRARVTPTVILRSARRAVPDQWVAVALTYDGAVARLYVEGDPVASAPATTGLVDSRLELAPVVGSGGAGHFGGSLALFTVTPVALNPDDVRALADHRPDFSLITFEAVGVGWPLQEHAWRGLQVPQDPWTLPHSRGLATPPVAAALPARSGGLRRASQHVSIVDDWDLAPAPAVDATGEQLSDPRYVEHDWYPAVVPGTVLSTFIARGVYPDPDHGLDNLAIPDSLSRQDYWYRSVFDAPDGLQGRDVRVVFNGINYAAEVFLNGRRLGSVRGAFTRGTFDVTGLLKAGAVNALAVRVEPPPHPGIPHEQSVAAGPGENGGALALDGPTFIATEGWDWVPGIRDRDTGIWQDVEIVAGGALQLGDPHVVTHLALPRLDSADVSIAVPVDNRRAVPVTGTVRAQFDDVTVEKAAVFPPGRNDVHFTAAEFPQLHLKSPRLWWPNGYGAANLYALTIDVRTGDSPSDSRSLRFGIRELTYDLSLFDHDGRLRRVTVDPTLGTLRGERLTDVRHESIKRTPLGWAASLTAAGETSPAVVSAASGSLAPYLVIRVNGVAIAARGGNWGMDDSRKRISRERLEPYFRLHRDAHLNVIRNWLGQNTEDVFYDLADEYGLLVLNDFWISTQEYQLEPEDPALFLDNARDVISRYRNHPSIAVWFGRNEGVPQPIINEGLAGLVSTLDGTRYYTGSSNRVNLQDSGPYNYRPPEQYFTTLARGFSVEVGTPSLATLETLRATLPAADLWPLGDAYAYHDWHFGGNGDVATFLSALAEQHGPGLDLEDFERKAQLMDFVSYRAIFEGFQAHLWTRNSGRLLWMSHPAWPSNTWQIYSSDYDTPAAYYAVKQACEPLHAQLNLPDLTLTVVNTTREPRHGLVLRSRVLSLDNRILGGRVDPVDVAADTTATLAAPPRLAGILERERLVLIKLTLSDAAGAVLSDNLYWQSRTPADQRGLDRLGAQPLVVTARSVPAAAEPAVVVGIRNAGERAVLGTKLTVLDPSGKRVLPVYYSDNFLSLLPGESRRIEIRCPAGGERCARVAVRGWNVVPQEVAVRGSATAPSGPSIRRPPSAPAVRPSPAHVRQRSPRAAMPPV